MTGLLNLGNTCAINSILQSIFNIESLIIKLSRDKDDNSLINSLIDLVVLMISNENKIIRPSHFIKNFFRCSQKTYHFIHGTQIDANEIWTFICNHIFKETRYPIVSNLVCTNPIYMQANKQLSLHNDNHTCQWNDIFQGSIIRITKCLKCNKKNLNFEPFYSLSIGTDKDSIVDILKDEFSVFQGNDDWICDSCNEKTPYLTSIKIWNIPKILVITLKRYDNLFKKINKPIKINKTINFTKGVILNNCKKAKFQLNSVVFHRGMSTNMGHYTNMNFKPNKVVYNDDSRCSEISDGNSEIDNPDIYMIFYERI